MTFTELSVAVCVVLCAGLAGCEAKAKVDKAAAEYGFRNASLH